MRLLKLELLNLASLDNPEGEVIDFENGPVGRCNIFSIVGPTGSGKSTILDAISLALFGTAPRYHTGTGRKFRNTIYSGAGNEPDIAPKDCRNILTRGKKSCYAKLTFLANNGHTYRAEWHTGFRRKKYSEVVTRLYVLECAADGTGVEREEDWASVPQIIGLDYNQFMRTVVIAQGSFANFLSADENTRYELLEKLVGNGEQYRSIAAEIESRRRQAAATLSEISSRVSAFSEVLLADDEVATLTSTINTLERQAAERRARLADLLASIGWYESEKLLFDAVLADRIDRDRALLAVMSSAPVAARLGLFDRTRPAVDILNQIRRLETEIAETDRLLADLATKIVTGKSSLNALQSAAALLSEQNQKAAADLESARPAINKARTIKGTLAAALKNLADSKIAVLQAEKDHSASCDDLKKNSEEADKASIYVSELKTSRDELAAAAQKELKTLDEAVARARNELTAEEAAISADSLPELRGAKAAADVLVADISAAVDFNTRIKAKTDARTAAESEIGRLASDNASLTAALAAIDTATLTSEITTLRDARAIMLGKNLLQLRENLVENQPCPLCGALHHPYSDSGGFQTHTDAMQAAIYAKQKELDAALTRREALQSQINANNGAASTLELSLKSIVAELDTLTTGLDAITARRPECAADSGSLQSMLVAARKSSAAADKALDDYNARQLRVNNLRKEYDATVHNRDTRRTVLDEAVRRADTQLNEAEKHLSALTAKAPVLAARSDELLRKFGEAIGVFDNLNVQVSLLQDDLRAAIGDGDPDAMEKALSDKVAATAAALKTRNEEILAAEKSMAALRADEKSALERHKTACTAKDSAAAALSAWIGNHPGISRADVESVCDAPDDWEAMRRQLKQTDDAFTAALATLERSEAAYRSHFENAPAQSRADFEAERDRITAVADDELVAARARLSEHQRASAQLAGLKDVYLRAREDDAVWAKIYDAIGADGKTMRRIAQCFTLGFLVRHANAEIRRFNRRYELVHVPDSLAIRVVDHDRGDDVRETSSLSGGETFIVSLGLALGLSSLSSRNVSFSNLFIDEGFGTLDPDSLAMVIDSLASLQSNQGKKVGVISHTDMMSERISTRISVVPVGNSGGSRIEIIGG